MDAQQNHRYLLPAWALHRDHEIGDPQDLFIRCILNGEVMQDGTTRR